MRPWLVDFFSSFYLLQAHVDLSIRRYIVEACACMYIKRRRSFYRVVYYCAATLALYYARPSSGVIKALNRRFFFLSRLEINRESEREREIESYLDRCARKRVRCA